MKKIDYFRGGALDGLERESSSVGGAHIRQDGHTGEWYALTVEADNARVWERCEAPSEPVALSLGASGSRAPVTMGDLRDLVLNADIHSVPAETPVQVIKRRRKVVGLFVPLV